LVAMRLRQLDVKIDDLRHKMDDWRRREVRQTRLGSWGSKLNHLAGPRQG
jgi:hypothetical protein